VYMCTELLPPGNYPIGVKYIISYANVINFSKHRKKKQQEGQTHANTYRITWFAGL